MADPQALGTVTARRYPRSGAVAVRIYAQVAEGELHHLGTVDITSKEYGSAETAQALREVADEIEKGEI